MAPHIAIVTGGGRGIGRAVVERLHRDGARVLACGRGEEPQDLPAGVAWLRADVARSGEAERIVAAANAAFGPVSLLVNNAGVQVALQRGPTRVDHDRDGGRRVRAGSRSRGRTPRRPRPPSVGRFGEPADIANAVAWRA